MISPGHHEDTTWRRLHAQASDIGGLRASRLTGCLRQTHYHANNTPPTDHIPPPLGIAATLGTAIHREFVPAHAHTLRTIYPTATVDINKTLHMPLENGYILTGTPDIVTIHPDGAATVWDLKTHESTRFDATAADPQTATKSWTQVMIYAAMLEYHGHTVTQCQLYHLDRSDPQAHKDYRRQQRRFLSTLTYTDQHREHARTIITTAATAAENINHAPRWFSDVSRADSLYSPCRSCPWQTTCLGKALQSETVCDIDADAAAELARGLIEAKKLAAEAKKSLNEYLNHKTACDRKDKIPTKIRSLLDDLGIELDDYYQASDGTRIRFYESGAATTTDTKAMKDILTEQGIPIPTKPRARSLSIEILPPE